MNVTENVSAQVGSAVLCNGCEAKKNDELSRNRKWALSQIHCRTCHSDRHRACMQCGSCMPNGHRWDRECCSSTCRGRRKRELVLATLERAAWEAEHPEEAEKQRAKLELLTEELTLLSQVLGGSPEAVAKRRREQELKLRADRCAQCDRPFGPEEVIYRVADHLWGGLVLPYCGDHRCRQLEGRHNKDAGEGHYYPACRCEGRDGDRHWTAPAPCTFCGRLVCYDRKTANPWRFTRDWSYRHEDEKTVRTFCSDGCKRAFYRVQAKGKRLASRGDVSNRCQACNRSFTPNRPDARYCSNACRQKAYRQRQTSGGVA